MADEPKVVSLEAWRNRRSISTLPFPPFEVHRGVSREDGVKQVLIQMSGSSTPFAWRLPPELAVELGYALLAAAE